MNNLRNQVQLIGNVGKDPELKTFGNDRAVANFSVATSDTYKNSKGEKVIETQWHRIVAWGKVAELVGRLLKKGSQVVLKGKLTHEKWEDQHGQTRYATKIVLNDFVMIGSKAVA